MLGLIPKILTLSTHGPNPKLLLGIVMLLLLLLSPVDAGGYALHGSRFSAATADMHVSPPAETSPVGKESKESILSIPPGQKIYRANSQPPARGKHQRSTGLYVDTAVNSTD